MNTFMSSSAGHLMASNIHTQKRKLDENLVQKIEQVDTRSVAVVLSDQVKTRLNKTPRKSKLPKKINRHN